METRTTRGLILLICVTALIAGIGIGALAFERLPHLEDEVAYLFQAKTFALGRLTVPSPAHADAFWIPFVLDYRGQRFGKYSPGWPAILALGELVSAPWIVNPALAALALYLVYRLGSTLYDARTGVLAAALGLTSPSLLVLSGSYLSHMASLFWLLLFTLWFVRVARGRSDEPGRSGTGPGKPAVLEKPGLSAPDFSGRWYAVGSGIALGLAFLTRSLTAIGYAAPFVIYSLAQVVLRRQRHWPNYLLIALAGGVVSALLPAYQWAVTGDPFLNPYVLWWPYDKIGFGPGVGWMPGGHSLHYAWLNLKQDLTTAATDVLGWPGLSWVPMVLALALPPRTWRERLLWVPFATLVVAYLFYWIGSPMRLWGPRYYFEGFGVLWVLAATGLWRAWDRLHLQPAWQRAAALAVLAGLLTVNLGINLSPRLAQARGFYGITREQLRPIAEAGLHNALVFIKAERWLEYGAMLADMSPLLTDDVLYARSEGEAADAAVMAHYPGRAIYYLEKGRLQPFRP